MLEFREEVAKLSTEYWAIGNIDETPLRWYRNRDMTWALKIESERGSLLETQKQGELAFRKRSAPDAPHTPHVKKARTLGHADLPQYANNFLTVVTATTVFTKGPLVVLAKEKQVGATVGGCKTLNDSYKRKCYVTKNSCGAMGGELYHKELYPRQIRPMFTACRKLFGETKASAPCLLLEDTSFPCLLL